MKELYRRMNEAVVPPEDLKDKVFAKLEKPKRRLDMRPLTAAALVLALVLSVGPMTVSGAMVLITDLMYLVSPETAARFSPIQKTDTENGIRMEVVSASVRGPETEVYVTFEDLKGDRLDGEISLVDGSLYRKGSGSEYLNRDGHYEVLEYDSERGIQTIMEGVTHEASSGDPGEDPFAQANLNEKMMYVVEEIQIITEKVNREIPYTDTEPEIVEWREEEISIIGMGGTEEWVKQQSFRLLAAGEPMCDLYQGLELMSMGFIDGQFHVLVRETVTEPAQTLGYGVRLFDEEGNSVIWENGISYAEETGAKYSEWIFFVSEAEMEQYTPVFDISKIETIEGPWRVTFPVTAGNDTDE